MVAQRPDGAVGAGSSAAVAESPGDPTRDLPYAHGGPVLTGHVRATAEDFVVEEVLGYAPSGAGEHVFLRVCKRGHNTHDVARILARHAGVAQVAVGYAGLKDRNAVTTQHFTVQLPGREAPDWRALEDESLRFLAFDRHHRKIRRGGLRGNRFVIALTGCAGDRDAAEVRLRQIAAHGVPNYFGSQRFGRNGQNLQRAADLLAGVGRRPGREQRGLLLSAARARLFNRVLAARVADGSWDALLDGDVVALAGANRHFAHDPDDPTIAQRLERLDLHPTGPLCGRPGRALNPALEAARRETAALETSADWVAGLQRFALDADRRALRLAVDGLEWAWHGDRLELRFALTAGAYATTVLRELVSDPPPAGDAA